MDMNFGTLSGIIREVDTLAELEAKHPVLGRDLGDFLTRLKTACEKAYEHFLENIQPLTTLDAPPVGQSLKAIREQLGETYSHHWFKNVGRVCDILHSLDDPYGAKLQQIGLTESSGPGATTRLWALVGVIDKHEKNLEEDIESAARSLENALETAVQTGDAMPLRQMAIQQRQQLSEQLRQLQSAVTRSVGTSNRAVGMLKEEIAESALASRPMAMYLLNGFFLLIFLAAFGAVANYFPWYTFVLISGAAFTGLVLLNAFHLRQIGALSEENFLSLIRLALLKFFAPLTRRRK
jgi:hypothetical protein